MSGVILPQTDENGIWCSCAQPVMKAIYYKQLAQIDETNDVHREEEIQKFLSNDQFSMDTHTVCIK